MAYYKNPPKTIDGRPLKYQNAAAMQLVIDKYFADADAKDGIYTVAGLALALGMTRQGLLDYEKRGEFLDTVKSAKQRIEEQVERRMLSGQANVAGLIFHMKNNAGYVDRQEVKEESDTKLTISWGATQDAKSNNVA